MRVLDAPTSYQAFRIPTLYSSIIIYNIGGNSKFMAQFFLVPVPGSSV